VLRELYHNAHPMFLSWGGACKRRTTSYAYMYDISKLQSLFSCLAHDTSYVHMDVMYTILRRDRSLHVCQPELLNRLSEPHPSDGPPQIPNLWGRQWVTPRRLGRRFVRPSLKLLLPGQLNLGRRLYDMYTNKQVYQTIWVRHLPLT
jgi:hypothetical protein